jgi:acetyl-CoA C-acetyltransferase
VAAEYGISRLEQDEWAVRSHMNYGKAWKEGKFKDEMIPIEIPQKGKDPFILDIDEQYRADATVEKMSKLKPIYGCKAVTAGNAPGLNDGATAIIVMTRGKAQQLGLKPLGTILAMTSIAIHPNRMPEGPGFAIKKVLSMANVKLDQIDAIEINEAFAAVPLVSIEVVCDRDKAKAKELHKKTNINGSAIAIGHPNTSSGARIMMTLAYELRRRGGGYAIGAICGGLAQADACVIKVEG